MLKLRRLAVVLAAVVGVLAVAIPASAHVTVNPKEAVQGGFGRLAFRVPTESDTDSTTKVEIFLPENAPVGSVSIMPVPGWTAVVTKRKLDTPIDVHGSQIGEVVSQVTWTASGDAAIKPGEFQEFPVSMGPLPKVDQMVFKALQTYSDGTVVRWIDEGADPEHPAPILKLLPAVDAAAAAPSGATVVLGPDEPSGSSWTTFAALGAGLAALVLSGIALARTRRDGPAAPPNVG
jgi:periplasmic copper chaperone A